VADTHLYQAELTVPEGDVFVHAGDMARAGDLDELAEVAAWIAALPHRHKIVIAGNHDWAFAKPDERDRARELFSFARYLEDDGVTIDGVRFWGSPWQPAFNDWAFNLPRGAALAEKWAQIPEGVDVLVTHVPPAKIGDRGPTADRHGCGDLRARVAIVKPKAHLFGHIHTDGGAWDIDGTLFANVTTWECERQPTVLDFENGIIAPVVVPPARR
ncbi:MAG TPA: metallophosphatase domain-containing protein, partial [Polyangiaceae bacterium]